MKPECSYLLFETRKIEIPKINSTKEKNYSDSLNRFERLKAFNSHIQIKARKSQDLLASLGKLLPYATKKEMMISAGMTRRQNCIHNNLKMHFAH